ncbi:MAG: hypothetical protein Fur0021_38020 [Candidatus Promineifilaceae bacterium]
MWERYPQLKHASAALAWQYAFHELVSDEALQAMGTLLWAALMTDDPGLAPAFAAARQAAGAAILPIVIESADAAVQQLPWETLYHPDHAFLGKSPAFTLLRRIPPQPPQLPPLETGPLRVLLFTSLPDDLDPETGRLSVEEQQALVLEALAPFISQGIVQLEMPDDGRFATFQALLHDFQPHLLFLFGHGKFYDEPHQTDPPYAIFQFEDDDGGSHDVPDREIAGAFYGSRVQCVALAACESGKGSSAALTHGLVWQLSQMGIPHVIGMRESILERAGILFNQALCRALAAQQRIDVALQQARQAITTPLKESVWLKSEAEGLSEMSLGQWCLPTLASADAGQPLIDWAFTPQPPRPQLTSQTLETISLPPRFVGRRSELRDLKSRLRRGALRQLLITGPGGQGKTALAGKLAQDLQRRGYLVLAWGAQVAENWDAFLLELELQLSPASAAQYTRLLARLVGEQARAALLLRLLLADHGQRVALFLDNLEAVQDPQTLAIADERAAAWVAAAQGVTGQGLVLLLTSRWRWTEWPEADHWPLRHASYGDFLQMALAHKLSVEFLRDRERLRRVYRALHGNGRGLQFFAAATQGMTAVEEEAFLARLAQAEAELQTNMALAAITQQLTADEQELLQRLRAYQTPVPIEGVVKVGLELPEPQRLLARLVDVSLVERQDNAAWQAQEYQLPQPVASWLASRLAPPAMSLRRAAAAYLDYLYRRERGVVSQAILLHQAWQAAGEQARADRLALDGIVGWLSQAGLYRTLLRDWLPDICESPDRQTRAEALGQTGKQHLHLGNYDTALAYLQRSLQISQEIGDKAGEGTTLNNISQIYDARGDYDTALAYLQRSLQIRQEIGDVAGLCATLFNMGHMHWQSGSQAEAVDAWVTVYLLAKRTGLAQALQALAGLAQQLELPGGLDGWEALARQMRDGDVTAA